MSLRAVAPPVNTLTTPTTITVDSASDALRITQTGAGNALTVVGTTSLGAAPNAESLRVIPVASAVNYLQMTGSATGNSPVLSAQGSDASVSFVLQPKGTGNLVLQSNGAIVLQNTSGANQFVVANTASAVNWLEAKGQVTSGAPQIAALGSDTNIDLALIPKGTGNVRFGAHTVGVLTPTGYVTIKDAAGNTRRLLVG